MLKPALFKPVLGASVSLFIILLLEAVLRVGAFVWHDYSQYYLFHGFHNLVGRVGITPSYTNTGRHYKFPPNYRLRGAAGQAGETAAINSLGFRGPDFQPSKPQGTFRVVCLGESSTFGFHNSDDETYPFLLGRLFQQQPGNPTVEVINAGFPYYNTASILSLLQADILSLEPDLLTIYAAYNDAGWDLQVGAVDRLTNWLQEHSITYLLMKESVLTERVVRRWRGAESGGAWDGQLKRESFDAYSAQIAARYRRNVEAIIGAAGSKGIPVILIKQPMTARYGHIQTKHYSMTYEDEYRQMRHKFETTGALSPVQYHLLVHHRLIEELDAIAKREQIDLVDNVAIVDRDRRLMASYVHLTAEANLQLARALKPVIEKYVPKQKLVSSHTEPSRNAQ